MSGAGPRLRVVTGKGGVGKTVVATALALAEAQRGRTVLLTEFNGKDSVAALLEAQPVGPQMREVQSRLYVVDIEPHEAMREYALLTLRFETVYKAVFENRLVRRFLRLVPSLGELVMLGKVWYHEQQKIDGKPRFDVIIVDLPATGHAVSLLRAARVVQQAMPPGPLRDNARLINEMLTDPERTVVHVVTTPEEMPVNEATHLFDVASNELGMATSTTFINQRLSALPQQAYNALCASTNPVLHSAASALKIREEKRLEGELQLARLPGHMRDCAHSLPRVVCEHFGVDAVTTLSEAMASVLEPAGTEPQRPTEGCS